MSGGYWYCPNCKTELEGRNVTYTEHCDFCGANVLSIDDDITSEELSEILIARNEGRLIIVPK
jgi:hypothetical protein